MNFRPPAVATKHKLNAWQVTQTQLPERPSDVPRPLESHLDEENMPTSEILAHLSAAVERR